MVGVHFVLIVIFKKRWYQNQSLIEQGVQDHQCLFWETGRKRERERESKFSGEREKESFYQKIPLSLAVC